MPQMAPINWLFLYFLFIMIYFMINFLNYYLFLYKNNNLNQKTFKNLKMNWKW
uniref:ATP synthase complex subunit 8 n=1 Tax=Bembidion varium TaxID=1166835 RepID=A0A343C266_9CARA|nr:ATP synthase F0 subunit 8 [Bembidion varium]